MGGAPPTPTPPSQPTPPKNLDFFFFFFRFHFFFFFLKNPKTRKPGFENPETRPNLTPDFKAQVIFANFSDFFFCVKDMPLFLARHIHLPFFFSFCVTVSPSCEL